MKEHKKANDQYSAWQLEEKFEGLPHGSIQWKGTEVCMDINCICGHQSHIDAEFLYYVQCPECKKVYSLNGHIELIEITNPKDIKFQTAE